MARLTVAERFWSKVRKSEEPNGCWHWIGGVYTYGYGQFHMHPKPSVGAHRFSYVMHNGPIPAGMYICHACDNPLCVNPAHLWVGSQKQNIADMMNKGRKMTGEKMKNSKLTEEIVRSLRVRNTNGESIGALAKEYGIDSKTAWCAIKRLSWKHVA